MYRLFHDKMWNIKGVRGSDERRCPVPYPQNHDGVVKVWFEPHFAEPEVSPLSSRHARLHKSNDKYISRQADTIYLAN